ncbi:MAG TPA: hypothetical protein VE991_11145, partial [Acidimicrobiales bacterium]|nr:hypothetical protein [Acidimicrobiales bacterium]
LVVSGAAVSTATVVPVVLGGAPPAQAVTAHATPVFNLVWSDKSLGDAGNPIAFSSPNVVALNGVPSVVVGDRAGHVFAERLDNGATVPGWPYSTGGVPVDSTPSVDGSTVFVGAGNAADPTQGGYYAIAPSGATQWFVSARNPSTDPTPVNGVQASMAIGNLQGVAATVAGSLGENEYAMNIANGGVLPGFPWFQADSNFTTPALADVYSNGQNEIVEGGDSTAGLAYNTQYQNGGHIRVLAGTGNQGAAQPNGGLLCSYDTDQTVQSSPAVGEFLGGGGVGIVAGTGATYGGASTTNDLIALTKNCGVAWIDKLDGTTTGSPALANLSGTGALSVVEGTANGGSGAVWALDGPTGHTLWHSAASGAVLGSPATVDLGGGYQDVIVATTNGADVFDGKTGTLLATVDSGVGFQNTPLITDDPNGTVGVTLAGYNSSNAGQIDHFEVAASNGSIVGEAGAWPMFHHDPQLTGDAGTPPPNVQVPCSAPSSPSGYDLAASDGGVFNFGLPFCGSMGGQPLAQPVRTISVTHDGGGYWLAAADGGLFAFGDAQFYGSVPQYAHVTNVVGMAVTPDGGGYWMVGSDGGIFSFGDARFHGSVPQYARVNNVVGIASTPDGGGYWVVGSDGGIYAFGDARFDGSVPQYARVNNIVGMAPDWATGGYWVVGDDGGLFSFNAPFKGSVPQYASVHNVVGMEAAPNGSGYRMAGSDGGVYCFGEPFDGSVPQVGVHVNNVIGISGF